MMSIQEPDCTLLVDTAPLDGPTSNSNGDLSSVNHFKDAHSNIIAASTAPPMARPLTALENLAVVEQSRSTFAACAHSPGSYLAEGMALLPILPLACIPPPAPYLRTIELPGVPDDTGLSSTTGTFDDDEDSSPPREINTSTLIPEHLSEFDITNLSGPLLFQGKNTSYFAPFTGIHSFLEVV